MAAFVRSNRRSLSLGLIVALLSAGIAVPALVSAQNPPAPAAAAPVPNLDRNMGAMNRAFRAIKTGIKDKTKNDAALASLAQMQTATVAAKGQTPPMIEKAPEADRAKKLAEYRGMMIKLVRAELDLEEQLLAGDNDKAATTVAAIDEIQKQGHTAFRPAE